jgi:hypothetical protein
MPAGEGDVVGVGSFDVKTVSGPRGFSHRGKEVLAG